MRAVLISALVLTGCAMARASAAYQAQQDMIGMSRKDVLLCAGKPLEKTQDEGLELWTYAAGGQTDVIASAGRRFGAASIRSRSCLVTVVFDGEMVRQVNYSGRTGGALSPGEQCAFVVGNCLKSGGGT